MKATHWRLCTTFTKPDLKNRLALQKEKIWVSAWWASESAACGGRRSQSCCLLAPGDKRPSLHWCVPAQPPPNVAFMFAVAEGKQKSKESALVVCLGSCLGTTALLRRRSWIKLGHGSCLQIRGRLGGLLGRPPLLSQGRSFLSPEISTVVSNPSHASYMLAHRIRQRTGHEITGNYRSINFY